MIASGGSYYKIANGSIDSAELPGEYQQVEYIQNTGSSYIHSVIAANKLFVFDMQYNDDNARYLMGISPSAGEFFGNNQGVWEKVGTNGTTKTTLDRVKLYYDIGNITSERVTTWLEGATNRYTGSSLDFETYSNTQLDFFKVSNTSAFWSKMKLFNVKVYDNQNTLLNNFIPCYRISDNVIGMYDTVNDVFYTNQGTGTFLKGPNVYNRYKIENVESIYHIRGTATDDFDFTLKYIDRNNNITTVTEHAIIDGNGNWDISYKDKLIYSLSETFKENSYIKTIEFTEKLDNLVSLYYSFRASALQSVTFNNETTLPNVTTMNRAFAVCYYLVNVNNTKNFVLSKCTTINRVFDTDGNLESDIDFRNATLVSLTDMEAAFYSCRKVSTIRLDNADFSKVSVAGSFDFQTTISLKNIYLKQNSSHAKPLNFGSSPLLYDSMLNIANWLKDLTGLTAQTVTFKSSTYSALTSEQKAELESIIVTQKCWNLATV